MMTKKHIFIALPIVFIVLVLVFALYPSNETNVKKETKNADVLIIGKNHPFKKSDVLSFESLSLNDAEKEIPKNIRFVLISSDEEVSSDVLNKWIDEKKVVLFYGNNLSPESIEKKFQKDFDLENILIQSSVEIPYILFGYGFSNDANSNVVWFLNGNKELQDSIFHFIDNNKNK